MRCEERVLGVGVMTRLVADLNYPPVTFGKRLLNTPKAWQAVLTMSPRSDRRTLLHALGEYLLRDSQGSRDRLELWTRNGRPAPLTEWLEENLVIHGDRSGAPLVFRVLARMPDPVRWFTALRCAFIVVRETRGWHQASLFVGQDGGYRDRLIVLGPTADEDTTAHEIAHAWRSTCDPDAIEPPIAVDALGEAGLRALATEQGWMDTLEAATAREERLADALAACWLVAPRAMEAASVVPS